VDDIRYSEEQLPVRHKKNPLDLKNFQALKSSENVPENKQAADFIQYYGLSATRCFILEENPIVAISALVPFKLGNFSLANELQNLLFSNPDDKASLKSFQKHLSKILGSIKAFHQNNQNDPFLVQTAIGLQVLIHAALSRASNLSEKEKNAFEKNITGQLAKFVADQGTADIPQEKLLSIIYPSAVLLSPPEDVASSKRLQEKYQEYSPLIPQQIEEPEDNTTDTSDESGQEELIDELLSIDAHIEKTHQFAEKNQFNEAVNEIKDVFPILSGIEEKINNHFKSAYQYAEKNQFSEATDEIKNALALQKNLKTYCGLCNKTLEKIEKKYRDAPSLLSELDVPKTISTFQEQLATYKFGFISQYDRFFPLTNEKNEENEENEKNLHLPSFIHPAAHSLSYLLDDNLTEEKYAFVLNTLNLLFEHEFSQTSLHDRKRTFSNISSFFNKLLTLKANNPTITLLIAKLFIHITHYAESTSNTLNLLRRYFEAQHKTTSKKTATKSTNYWTQNPSNKNILSNRFNKRDESLEDKALKSNITDTELKKFSLFLMALGISTLFLGIFAFPTFILPLCIIAATLIVGSAFTMHKDEMIAEFKALFHESQHRTEISQENLFLQENNMGVFLILIGISCIFLGIFAFPLFAVSLYITATGLISIGFILVNAETFQRGFKKFLTLFERKEKEEDQPPPQEMPKDNFIKTNLNTWLEAYGCDPSNLTEDTLIAIFKNFPQLGTSINIQNHFELFRPILENGNWNTVEKLARAFYLNYSFEATHNFISLIIKDETIFTALVTNIEQLTQLNEWMMLWDKSKSYTIDQLKTQIWYIINDTNYLQTCINNSHLTPKEGETPLDLFYQKLKEIFPKHAPAIELQRPDKRKQALLKQMASLTKELEQTTEFSYTPVLQPTSKSRAVSSNKDNPEEQQEDTTIILSPTFTTTSDG